MKSKRIDHINNVTAFLPKIILSSVQMQEKLKTCRNANLKDFSRPSKHFQDYKHVKFIP